MAENKSSGAYQRRKKGLRAVTTYVTQQDYVSIKRVAALAGVTMTAWTAAALIEAAGHDLAHSENPEEGTA